MKKYALGIDFGTQSLRIIAFDDKGNAVCKYHETYEKPYVSPQKGFAEQDPNYYIKKLCLCTNRFVKENPEVNKNLLGISISCFRDSSVFLDQNYIPVRPMILWLDQRLAKGERNLPFFSKAIIKLSGMFETADLNMKKTPANWLMENEKKNWEKVRHYWAYSTYLNYFLTGNEIDTPAQYAGHYPINMKKYRWNSDNHFKSHIFGIPVSYLPQLLPPNSVVGYINDTASAHTGLRKGIPVYAGAGDKMCESLGVGAVKNNIGSISYGTSCSIEIPTKKYHDAEGFLPSYASPINHLWEMELQVYRGYWMLDWFAKNFAYEEKTLANLANEAVEEVLNKKMSEVPPGSDGLILQPYWGPSLKRPLAKGVILGFSDYHTKYHLYRAIIEGIAFTLKEGLLKMQRRRHKGKINELYISGGGANSSAICQITADIFNLPVSKVQTNETASLGAAIIVFVSSKHYSSYQEAVNNMVHKTTTYLPNPTNVILYKELYEDVYVKIYHKIKPLNINIRKILNR